MSKVIFSGSVTAQAQEGETVEITVIKPDGVEDLVTTVTKADKTFTAEKEYGVPGNYVAQAHGDEDATYTAWDSNTVSFSVPLQPRTGTLNVTV